MTPKGCYGDPHTGRTGPSAPTRNSVGADALDLFYRTIMLSVGAGFSCPPSCQPIPGHRCGRQSGHFLETGSLPLPPAALRRFPRPREGQSPSPAHTTWKRPHRADRVVCPCKEFRRGRCPRPVLPHYHAIRRGGVLPRPREGQSPSPTHTTWNRPHRADRVVRPVPHSKITAPLFFSARPERIRSRVSAKGSLVCSPVFISLQATTPAAISSSPRKIT